MHIWVDADACPRPVKEILYRAAVRKQIPLTLVSNLYLRTPKSPFIKTVQVAGGFDVADEHIIQMIKPGDLVITADIPLAASAIEGGAAALNPRGKLYTKDNIAEALTMRNLKDELRSAGVETGGPSAFKAADRQAFANQLERMLSALNK